MKKRYKYKDHNPSFWEKKDRIDRRFWEKEFPNTQKSRCKTIFKLHIKEEKNDCKGKK